eukprot:2594126-Rhodomonas_salina.1
MNTCVRALETRVQQERAGGRGPDVSSRVQEIERKVDALGQDMAKQAADMERLNLAVTSGMAQLLNRLNQLDASAALKPDQTISVPMRSPTVKHKPRFDDASAAPSGVVLDLATAPPSP